MAEYVKGLEEERKKEFKEIIREDLKDHLSKNLKFSVSDAGDYKYNVYYMDKLIFVDMYEWDIEHLFTFPISWAVKDIEQEASEPDLEEVSEFRENEMNKEIKNTKENYTKCYRCGKFYRKDAPYKHYCDT